MNFNPEQIQKAKAAASAAELLELAKAEGIELTEAEAEQYYSFLNTGSDCELPDDALEAVAGGKGSSDPDPKYKVGQHLWLGYFTTQNYLEVTVYQPEFYKKGDGWRYLVQVPQEYGGFLQNEYLETRKYVHTADPGPGWHD